MITEKVVRAVWTFAMVYFASSACSIDFGSGGRLRASGASIEDSSRVSPDSASVRRRFPWMRKSSLSLP